MASSSLIVSGTTLILGRQRAGALRFGTPMVPVADVDSMELRGSGKVLLAEEVADVTAANLGDEAVAIATAFFSQPGSGPLLFSNWITATGGRDSRLIGGAPVALDHIRGSALTGASGTGTLTFNGQQIAGSVRDTLRTALGTAATYAAVATALQTAITAATPNGAGLTGATVSYSTVRSRFIVELDGAGTIVAAGGTLAPLLGLDSASGAETVIGRTTAEPWAEFVAATDAVQPGTYFIILPTSLATVETAETASESAEAGNHQVLIQTNEPTLLAANSGSLWARLAGRTRTRTTMIYSAQADHKNASLAAVLAAMDLDGRAAFRSTMGMRLRGSSTDALTDAEVTALRGYGVNYYTMFGTQSMYADGVTLSPGVFTDTMYGLDWLDRRFRDVAMTAIRDGTRMTRASMSVLRVALESECGRAADFGFLGPMPNGERLPEDVTSEIKRVTGNSGFSGRLELGYLVHIEPLSQRTEQQKQTRTLGRIRAWLYETGYIHRINFELALASA